MVLPVVTIMQSVQILMAVTLAPVHLDTLEMELHAVVYICPLLSHLIITCNNKQ